MSSWEPRQSKCLSSSRTQSSTSGQWQRSTRKSPNIDHCTGGKNAPLIEVPGFMAPTKRAKLQKMWEPSYRPAYAPCPCQSSTSTPREKCHCALALLEMGPVGAKHPGMDSTIKTRQMGQAQEGHDGNLCGKNA